MPNIKWGTPLKEGQRPNPVVYVSYVDLPADIIEPSEEQLAQVFDGTPTSRIKTWARKKGSDGKAILEHDPHWIATKKGLGLHNDPRYPRYTHHLKIKVDEGIYTRGVDLAETKLQRGLFYILDTHSPHQILHKNRQAVCNVSVSVDSYDILDEKIILPQMLEFARTTDFERAIDDK